MTDTSGDHHPHPIVDVDDRRHPVGPAADPELPVILGSDPDDRRGSAANDRLELGDTDPITANELADFVLPDASSGEDRRRSPGQIGPPVRALGPARRRHITMLRSGVGPETQSGHLKHSFRGHLPREWWARGDLNPHVLSDTGT